MTSLPYAVTLTGLPAGSYTITAVATDGSGLANSSAPVSITVNPGAGQPYGLTNISSAPAFYNMPAVFHRPVAGAIIVDRRFRRHALHDPGRRPDSWRAQQHCCGLTARKRVRYFSIPNAGASFMPAGQIAYAPTNTWSFPAGAVFVKTFELPTNQSDPASLSAWKRACWCATPTARSMGSLTNGGRTAATPICSRRI